MNHYQNTAARRTPGDNRRQIRSMVQTAIFGAIIVIMAFTPFLGYIPLGFTRATIIHIPVILASLLLGPKKGAGLGFLFGLTSFINNTMNPTVTSFVFTPFYNLGEFSGGIKQGSFQSGTDPGGNFRRTGEYFAGHEHDLSVFQRSLCGGQ